MRDQPIVGNFTWQHTTPTWDRHTYRRWYLNPALCGKRTAANLLLRPRGHLYLNLLSCHSKKNKMFWPFCNVFMLLVAKLPCCVITSQESSFRISRFPDEICHFCTNAHQESYPKGLCYNVLIVSLRSLYFKWMQVYLTCCMALLITFWPSTWRTLGSDINFVHCIFVQHFTCKYFSTSYNTLPNLHTAKFCRQTFFLSHFDLFYLLLVDVQIYCYTWSHSVAHTRLDSSGRGIGPSQRTQLLWN